MKVAPFRALTHVNGHFIIFQVVLRRNEGRPFQGIDTSFNEFNLPPFSFVEMKVAPFRALTRWQRYTIPQRVPMVEMKVAPFRALTQLRDYKSFRFFSYCRNEGRPFQGIDTKSGFAVVFHTTAKPLFFFCIHIFFIRLQLPGFPAAGPQAIP